MFVATKNERNLVIEILTSSFIENRSVNYLIPNRARQKVKISRLMAYSFDHCMRWGKVYISDNRKGCALLLFPECKKTTLWSVWLDLKLVLTSIGLPYMAKPLAREQKINKLRPSGKMAYLWFVGVDPAFQLSSILVSAQS